MKKNLEGLKYYKVSKIQVNKLIKMLGPSLELATPDFKKLMKPSPLGEERASLPMTSQGRGISTANVSMLNKAP